MGEEINRLSTYETECSKLEGVTIALQNKLSELTHQLNLSENNEVIKHQEQLILQLQEEIRDLKNSEAETSRKDEFIAELREEIERLKEEATKWKMLSDCSNGIQNMRSVQDMVSNTWKTTPNLSTKINLEDLVVKNAFPVEFEMVYTEDGTEFGEECLIDLETTNKKLMQQLEKLQKKYSISTGTVSSLKRELFRLESELQKCTLDRENLQKQLRGKQTQVCSMAMKFSRLRDNRKNEDLEAELKKEWAVQTHQISELTQEVSRRNKMIGSFKAELHRLKQDMATLKYQNTGLQKEKVDIQNSVILLQHSESQAKVALEEIHSRFESFRNKIIQAVYGAPGAKPPTEEITDHEVLSIMQILSGTNETARFCGQSGIDIEDVPGNEPLYSATNSMTVVFRSDYSNEKRFTGFRAFYAAEVNCSTQLFTERSGELMSPEFPAPYPKLSTCEYRIRVEEGFTILLEFVESFDVETHPEVRCPYDILMIKTQKQDHGPFCGATLPAKINTNSYEVDTTFKTDGSGSNTGWKIKYTTTAMPCPDPVTPAHGRLSPKQAKYIFKDRFVLTCDRGYELLWGNQEIPSFEAVCQKNGIWDKPMPKCSSCLFWVPLTCLTQLSCKDGTCHDGMAPKSGLLADFRL
ncbi:MASP2 protease, partial [Polypterus senegalus]